MTTRLLWLSDQTDADLPCTVLDDAGRPERAEFIRVQCERARLPDWDARVRPLRRRERVLLARHGSASPCTRFCQAGTR